MDLDLEQVFKDWERYYATLLRAKGWNADDERAVANHDRWFLQWVDRSPDLATTAERRAVRAEFDRRKALSDAAHQDVTQAAAQAAEEREAFLRAYLDPAERRRFDTWLVQHPDPDLEKVHGHVGVFDWWKQGDEEYRDRQVREAAEREAELHEQEAARRREFEGRVADATWRRGDTSEALRAVAAWVISDSPALEIIDPGVGGCLHPVINDLNAEVSAVDVEQYVDADAIGRWLVGHVGQYALAIGRWEWSGSHREWRLNGEPPHWKAIQAACERWATYTQLEQKAMTADGSEAEALRTLGYRLVALQDLENDYWHVVGDEQRKWDFPAVKPTTPPEWWLRQEATRAAASAEEADDAPSEDDDEVAEQQDRVTARRKRNLIRFVTKNPGCGIKAVGGGPKGRREDNVKVAWELVAEGKLVNRGTEQRPKFYAAGTEGTAED